MEITTHPTAPKVPLVTPTLIPPSTAPRRIATTTRSAPISFGGNKQQNRCIPMHRSESVPSPGKVSRPLDFIDSKDGHIWRAKYCVIKEGILYFYENAEDGESHAATTERLAQQDQPMEYDDLSKSPMPRSFMMGDNMNYSNGNHTNNLNVLWEKRVALEFVGEVRSAELEYGQNAFELQAENGDRLILKANDADDLKEWLYQFHRSLASLMKSFVDARSRWSSKTHAIDLHHPYMPPPVVFPPSMPNDNSFGARFKNSNSTNMAFSHGHGRSGLHRRRLNTMEEKASNELLLTGEHKIYQGGVAVAAEGEILDPKSDDNKNAVGYLHKQDSLAVEPVKAPPKTSPNSDPLPQKKSSPKAKTAGPWVPPHMRRKKMEEAKNGGSVTEQSGSSFAAFLAQPLTTNANDSHASTEVYKRGGCADPKLISGSIMDARYKKRMSSLVGKERTDAYGCYGGGNNDPESNEVSLHWDVGGVSQCGARKSNEDSFLICSNAKKAFSTLENYQDHDQWGKHDPGVFGIFDGHCGNEAARFATERFAEYFYNEWRKESDISSAHVKKAMQMALENLDKDFCRICTQDGRDWDSGSTAVVVAIVNEELIVSNLGDCRAVICRSAAPQNDHTVDDILLADGWARLEDDQDLDAQWVRATANAKSINGDDNLRGWYWKEVAEVHIPSRADEKQRIENANGWFTVEHEVLYGQMQRMDFWDEDVIEILTRCFSEPDKQSQRSGAQHKEFKAASQHISIQRVCGDLAVTRAIGDRDYKAEYNQRGSNSEIDGVSGDSQWWKCSLRLLYPKDHSGQFKGDLVSSIAESHVLKISHEGLVDEFLVLACDGLWDVIDPDDAVRVLRGLLFEKKWPAKQAAARLAELAIHLGSSDNITVIVIRFFWAARHDVGDKVSKACT